MNISEAVSHFLGVKVSGNDVQRIVGQLTLEDLKEIIESAEKERKLPRSKKNLSCQGPVKDDQLVREAFEQSNNENPKKKRAKKTTPKKATPKKRAKRTPTEDIDECAFAMQIDEQALRLEESSSKSSSSGSDSDSDSSSSGRDSDSDSDSSSSSSGSNSDSSDSSSSD